MVIRRRFRSILLPLALYLVSGVIVGYFVLHAHSGQRGLEAKREIKGQIMALTAELNALKAQRAVMEDRISRMRDGSIDRDLLEDLARRNLGMVHPNDLVIIQPGDGD
ncbi:septum formation initiator family protein [Camelimonas abortus]|uniref:Septum formation initiator family protein n=1 Tax=Camelimonas abortus TaxID=1017184 RepID=A0ABV7LDJ4_9HYPH